jgi:hypothetical protein
MLDRATIMKRVLRGLAGPMLLMLVAYLPALAHNGPPFPILENKKVGPCIIALWTHPDVGTGTFFVLLDPLPGGKVPNDLNIQIGVQPVTGRLPEVLYTAKRDDSRGQVQYNVSAEFDRQEMWRVHLIVRSPQEVGEAVTQVMVTPPGYGRWDLLLYALPFLAVAFLWYRGMSRRRRTGARPIHTPQK